MPVEYDFTPINKVLDGLPAHLGEWLDGKSQRLTYQVSQYLVDRMISETKVWTARTVAYEFAKEFKLGLVDAALEDSVAQVLDGMIERKLLKTPHGYSLKNASRNVKFRLKEDGAYFATAYLYVADLANQAGLETQVIEEILIQAKDYAKNW